MPWELLLFPSIQQNYILRALEDRSVKQRDAAELYALCILASEYARGRGNKEVDFKTVNQAITKRWPKGLVRVKKMAWKIRTTGGL